jgi:hypothetical protein
MTVSRIIKQELDRRGFAATRNAAQFVGVSTELLRRIVSQDHIPKDRTLAAIARKLDMDPAVLILAAHVQQLPRELSTFTLTPSSAQPAGGLWQNKRKWPLSAEQCDYLSQVLKPHEIQLLRKYRQLTADEKLQAVGYVNYMFATKRVPPPADIPAGSPPAPTSDD